MQKHVFTVFFILVTFFYVLNVFFIFQTFFVTFLTFFNFHLNVFFTSKNGGVHVVSVSLRRAAAFPVISLLIQFAGQTLCLLGHWRRHQPVIVVVAAFLYVLAGTIRYDTRCYFNVLSKANMSQLNLPHVK